MRVLDPSTLPAKVTFKTTVQFNVFYCSCIEVFALTHHSFCFVAVFFRFLILIVSKSSFKLFIHLYLGFPFLLLPIGVLLGTNFSNLLLAHLSACPFLSIVTPRNKLLFRRHILRYCFFIRVRFPVRISLLLAIYYFYCVFYFFICCV